MTRTGPTRAPAVAGTFYPDDPDQLQSDLRRYLAPAAARPRSALGVMAPHAGYVYSGGVAGSVFSSIEVPRRVVLLGPNHTGCGPKISVAPAGQFRIPGATIPGEDELRQLIMQEVPGAQADWLAHRDEHSLEVELPFLLARQPQLQIVAIVLARLNVQEALAVGTGLHRAISALAEPVLVVASSDMSHFLPDAQARDVDRIALEPILQLDPERLHETVEVQGISMCGYVPTTAMLAYARAAGAGKPELVDYATSGDVSGDRERVVGYAGVIVPPGAG